MRCRFGLLSIALAGIALVPTSPTDPSDQQITPDPEVMGEADDNLNGGDVTPDSTLSFLSDFI